LNTSVSSCVYRLLVDISSDCFVIVKILKLQWTSASRGVPVYSPALTSAHSGMARMSLRDW